MAKVTDQGLSGAVGNLVYYTLNGKKYVRAKPGKRKKKKGDKPNEYQAIFGKASRYGSAITKELSNHFLFRFGLAPYNRMRGWIRDVYAVQYKLTWEISAMNSGMCQLSNETDLRDYFKATIEVQDRGKGDIAIVLPVINPVLQLKVPAHTKKVNIKMIAISSDFKSKTLISGMASENYVFEYKNKLTTLPESILHTKQGDIAIVAIGLEYEMADGLYNQETRWLPAAAVAIGKMG